MTSDLPDGEAELVARVVAEYRQRNERWRKEGVVTHLAADLPGGMYVGLDNELLQINLEIMALSWKMMELRREIPAEFDAQNQAQWSERANAYHSFCDLALPFHDSRLRRVAELGAQTLRGLEVKARLFDFEWLGPAPSDNETTGTKLGRSICRDIYRLMGFIDQ